MHAYAHAHAHKTQTRTQTRQSLHQRGMQSHSCASLVAWMSSAVTPACAARERCMASGLGDECSETTDRAAAARVVAETQSESQRRARPTAASPRCAHPLARTLLRRAACTWACACSLSFFLLSPAMGNRARKDDAMLLQCELRPNLFFPASYNPFVFVLFEVYWSNQVCPSSCAPRRRVCSAHAAAHWASSGSTGPPCVNFRRGDDSCAKSGGEKVPLRTSRRPSTSDFSENAQGPAASVCAKGARDTRSRTPAWRAPAWRALARNRSCRN